MNSVLIVVIELLIGTVLAVWVPSGHAQTFSEQILKERAEDAWARGDERGARNADRMRGSLEQSRREEEAYRPVIVVPGTPAELRTPEPGTSWSHRQIKPWAPAPTDPMARVEERGRR